jgi:predicted Ser/Thr protein kinase
MAEPLFPDPDLRNVSLSSARSISLREELRARWGRGDRVQVEEILRHQPELQKDIELVLDLIFTEFVVREDLGERPAISEYVQRFPRFAHRLERLFALDHAFLDSATDPFKTVAPESGQGAKAQAAAALWSIGKYAVLRQLDEGGQARVFLAVHPTLGREVVIKLGHRGMSAPNREALIKEGRILAELDHPFLAKIYDLDFHEDRPFLVMEYIPGQNLEQYAVHQPLTPVQCAHLLAKVSRAMALAHQRGVIHRDLKPRNLLIDAKGEPRIIDFGLANFNDAWAEAEPERGISGTLQFMPPEQARGEKATPRSDLFALGGVLYFLLTRKVLFAGKTYLEVLPRAKACDFDRCALQRAKVPAQLERICLKALSPKPEERYGSADAFADDLEAFARPTTYRPVIAIAAGVVSVGLVIGLLVWQPWQQEAKVEPQPVIRNGETRPAPTLKIRVKRGAGSLEIVEGLRTKDLVNFQAKAPPGIHA